MFLAILSSLWTSASNVIVNTDGIRLSKAWMFVRREKSLAASEIGSIENKFCMSQGTTSYYNLQAQMKNGKKVTLASYLRGKRDAEWFADEVKKALGRQ
jgi:hypothetical protein